MSRYKLQLKPQGAIARDTSLTVQMQPLSEVVPTEVVAVVPPLLHLNLGFSPWGENRFSWAEISTDDFQTSDLSVTLTITDPTFYTVYNGSTFAGVATKIIPAGSKAVNFLTHIPYADGGTTLATATAAGYEPATASMSGVCIHTIQGVHYEVRSIDATTSVAQTSDNIHSALTLTNRRSAVISGFLDMFDRCHEDVITWTVTGTAPNVVVDAISGTPLEVHIWALGDLLGGTANAPGDTIIVTCKINGSTAGIPFAVYTFTFP